MTDRCRTFTGGTLILSGALLTLLFVSTDGNGQNPFPLLIPISVGLLINGVVCWTLSKCITSAGLVYTGAVIITEQVFALTELILNLAKPSADPHYAEVLTLLPVILAVYTAPMVLISSLGFVVLTRHTDKSKERQPAPSAHPLEAESTG